MTSMILFAASLLPISATPAGEPKSLPESPRSLTETLQGDAVHANDQSVDNRVERRMYLRVTGGLVTSEDSDGPGEDIEFDEGYLLSLGIGHRFGASDTGLGFAMELEGVYTDQDASSAGALQAVSDVTVAGAMVNGVLDFRMADQFALYGAGGIGAAWLDVGTTSDGLNDFSDEDGPFLAWQLKAGVAWNFSDSTALQVGYRFLNIDDAEIDDGIGAADFDLQTQQHALEVGLVFGI